MSSRVLVQLPTLVSPVCDGSPSRHNSLFDYESITLDGLRNGSRLVSFGTLCGNVGMINTLRGLGERFLSLGYSTPFLGISSAYMYPTLKTAKAAVDALAKEIAKNGLPAPITPLTFVFTGNGRASLGAQEIFKLLPHEFVKPSDLPTLAHRWHQPDKGNARFKVYGCVVEEEDMVARRHDADERKQQHGDAAKASTSWTTNTFDRREYHAHPELYVPTFHERIAPFANVIINATYWDRRYPRLLTNRQAQALLGDQRNARESHQTTPGSLAGTHGLLAVSDISCDIDGSVQFLSRTSTIDRPFYVYDAFRHHAHDGVDGEGVLMMGIEQLASELPRESTRSFSSALLNFAADLAFSDGTKPFEQQSRELPTSLSGACIAAHNELTPNYKYIERMRRELARSKVRPAATLDNTDAVSTTILLQGHLFDTGLINRALDKVELYNGSFDIRECMVRPNMPAQHLKSTSSAVVVLEAPSRSDLDALLADLRNLVRDTPAAEATITELESFD
ncbi:monofunctional lysine-ketoglutarate reductase 2, variant 1 [Capsaspora owczarzaki ATCC 30864]|uniref:Monofunctional lysine-ketoglutarate reductase 2, variant 1 n=1 Tax=Capsaspora owczarzaki (strain ATCC 30864) TaxID=595528 RepID=A0A0D2U9T2_CAPO3|nr:monofunctional lysine-ketoglutarate reductase 2, variant 1 [Capsaspora owczarzaki ATCC 30864]